MGFVCINKLVNLPLFPHFKLKLTMKKFHVLLILLLFSWGAVLAQTRVLTGIVKDSTGNTPMADVTVKVKDKNIATITGSDGSFTLNVPTTNTTLEISFVGYATQEVNVPGGQNNLVIQLGRSQATLNEVVVTALGISRSAKSLTYATQTVKTSELTGVRDPNNLINSL